MKIWKDTVQQGSTEWLANRAKRYNASDLACAMGIDPNGRKRTELVQLYAIGLEREFSEWVQKNVIDPGHEIEALARPIIEDRIDSALYAEVLVGDVDDLKLPLGASLDGITAGDDVTFECKRRNAALWASVCAGIVPEGNRPQCEQGLMLSGAEVCLFTVSDGTDEGTISCEYRSDPELRAKIIPTWQQFERDVANYVHVEHIERPAAEVSIELPALFVHAQGEITQHNMQEYGAALTAKLAEVRAIVLVTDQDFSNAKAAASMFRDQCKKLKLTKEAMLSQTVSIGEAARMMDAWHEDLRVTALQLEKDVEREDATKKAAIVAGAKADYADYVAALNVRIGGNWMPDLRPDFVQAIKNKRTYASMQDSVNTLLANAKVDADEVANRIERNRKFLSLGEPSDWIFLFPDFSSVCTKADDDFSALVNLRLGRHKEAEDKRLEAERASIQVEERAKEEREAAAKIEAAKQEAVRQERERAEQEAKAKAEEDQRGKASTEDVKPVAQTGNAADRENEGTQVANASTTPTPIDIRAVVVEHQDEIGAFMDSRNWKDENYVRAVLVEFVKFQTSRQRKAA